MSETEIIGLLGIIKIAYPRFYANITVDDTKSTVALWCEMFKDDNPKDITMAVKELICELEFPPTIADIKNRIKKYDENRRFHEYAQKLELEAQKEKKMLEERHKRNEIAEEKPKADYKKHLKNIHKILYGGNKNDV